MGDLLRDETTTQKNEITDEECLKRREGLLVPPNSV